MKWLAEIQLNSGKSVRIPDLTVIYYKQSDGTVVNKTDFQNFILPENRMITLVGEKHTVTLHSSAVQYLSLNKIS